MFDLEFTILTSLKIVFMYAAMQEGMILFPLRQFFEYCLLFLPAKINLELRKPLFDCVVCMSSIWGILFTLEYAELSLRYLFFLMQVGGINYLLSFVIDYFTDLQEKDL